MVVGVTDGYRKRLEITGVGYRAAHVGEKLQLTWASPTRSRSSRPPGISFELENPTRSRSSASTRSSSARSPPASA